ncbi:DUF262 domain-containing protein [Glaesserella parasuis]|uniref:DUF262 domain-containing protein n=1 Tax=Glaesserella parasuis TaxID=738 RepID=UPI003852DAAB
MKASELKIADFLTSTKVQFTIPVYQRNYDWKVEQCQQLLNDILSIGQDCDVSNHFIGSIVYIHNNGAYTSSQIKEWIIIDGQQRLTTIMLIYLVLYHLTKSQGKNDLADEINETILINKFSSAPYKLKLKPTDNHVSAMEYIYKGNFSEGLGYFSRLVENFKYFKSCITLENLDIVRQGLDKLMFVEVSLERGKDNPQRIFESLNSTGLALSEADLIRNYILMDLESDKQNIFFQYWDIIEKFAKDEANNESKVSDFIRNYLTKINKKIPNKTRIYEAFKGKYPRVQEKDLLELKQFSKYYGILVNPEREEDVDIRLHLQYIKLLEVKTAYPFLLNVYHDYSCLNKINKEQFIQILEWLQSFIVRRLVVGLPTNALNKIFMVLYNENELAVSENYVSTIVKSLSRRINNQRFPNDIEVIEALKNCSIYNWASKNRTYLFERLENFKNKEFISIINNKKISLEHIFPQNAGDDWYEDLDSQQYEFMQQKLHTLANLTLTGYNSELSNKSFIKKRELYKDSRLWLNSSLRSLSKWGKNEWEDRFTLLSERFLNIWKQPEYEEQDSEINLMDVNDLTYRKLISAQFQDIQLEVNNVTELYRVVIEQLFQEEPTRFLETQLAEKLCIVPDGKKDELRVAVALPNNYQMETNYSNNDKLARLKQVLITLNLENELFIRLDSFNKN